MSNQDTPAMTRELVYKYLSAPLSIQRDIATMVGLSRFPGEDDHNFEARVLLAIKSQNKVAKLMEYLGVEATPDPAPLPGGEVDLREELAVAVFTGQSAALKKMDPKFEEMTWEKVKAAAVKQSWHKGTLDFIYHTADALLQAGWRKVPTSLPPAEDAVSECTAIIDRISKNHSGTYPQTCWIKLDEALTLKRFFSALPDIITSAERRGKAAGMEEAAKIAELEAWRAADPYESTIHRAQKGIAEEIRARASAIRKSMGGEG